MEKIKQSRAASFAVLAVIYALAVLLGIWVYQIVPGALWLKLLLADVAATVLTFGFSLLFGNASVYDPYWSVQPPVILTALALSRPMGPAQWLVLAAVWVWGIRLTGNWAYTFRGLAHQDWRYTMLHEKSGAFYPAVNFFGIHMVPTLIVWLCVMPAVCLLEYGGRANVGSVIFCLLCIGAAMLQLTADTQMHRFRKRQTGGLMRDGLWKYARHPNYLGEILMWWGVALQAVCVMPERWWLLGGAVANTLLFLLVSIPMAEERQGKKEGFAQVRAETHMLLPIPKRRAEADEKM